MLTNRIQNIKRIIYHEQAGLMPGMQDWFDISNIKQCNQHINSLKKKRYVDYIPLTGQRYSYLQTGSQNMSTRAL